MLRIANANLSPGNSAGFAYRFVTHWGQKKWKNVYDNKGLIDWCVTPEKMEDYVFIQKNLQLVMILWLEQE